MIRQFIEFFIALVMCIQTDAQISKGDTIIEKDYPKFTTNPLKIPLVLAGNYAELRRNHFHAGLDFKTNQKEGYSIYAVEDGFVSRIKVSASGYGNVIYIDHPNGYTTVYAHCKKFSDKIQNRIRKTQYELQASEYDLYLEKDELIVLEGERIAISGNSGGSAGPHLHFEVRDTKTEEPINPMFFGYDVADNRRPNYTQTYIYPVEGYVNGKSTPYYITNYIEPINVCGDISFGIKATDRHSAANNNNGIYSIKTYVNDSLYFTYLALRHSFDETRYIYSLTDYNKYNNSKSWVYKTFIEEGNLLRMYERTKNNGILHIKDGSTYKVKIEVGDYKGNISTKKFTLKGKSCAIKEKEHNVHFNWFYKVEKESFKANLESFTLSSDEQIDYNYTNGKHIFGTSDIPVFKHFEISIKPTSKIDSLNFDKYIIKRESNKGRKDKDYYITTYKNGWFSAKVRDFGSFTLTKDLIAPTIIPKNLSKTKKVKSNSRLIFIIDDKVSGIKDYKILIDEKWILSVYDKKYKSLSLNLKNEKVSLGKHNLKIIVTDACNNAKIYNSKIYVY